jgi:PAS domain S-box-containing protein
MAQDRSRIFLLTIILIAVAMGATLVAITALYEAAVEAQRDRLIETAQSRARLIEAIARADKVNLAPDFPGGPMVATMMQIREAHQAFPGFGKTGEFTLARREKVGDQIVFLLSHRHGGLEDPEPVPFQSVAAEPMRQALLGRSGTLIGLDYRGEEVLAAYEPVGELDLGIVAKIDLSEVRSPFIRAGILAGASAFFLVLVGTIAIFRVTNPIIRRLKDYSTELEREVETRKEAEIAARRSEEGLKIAQQIAKIGSWNLDIAARTGKLSDEACRIYGLPLGEKVTFDKIYSLTFPEDRDFVNSSWKQALKKHPYEIEHRIEVDGQIRWLRAVVELTFDENNRAVTGVGTAADITERKLAEEDRARLEVQLRQSQKMEAIGTLAGGIAHDFNNLLTAILGYGELVHESLDEKDPLRDDIKQINRAAESAASLTRQLLAFSRKQIISPRVVDLNELVATSEKMLRRIIGEDLDFVYVPGPGLWRTKADPGQVDQVLVNLAVNARDALGEGGKLTIETQNVSLEEKHCQTCDEPIAGKFVMMAVSDNGAGMDEATLSNVFEPFFTTKEQGKGTGLGLSTVHGIIHQNNGHINVYSEPGRGTSFKIYWPAVDGESVAELESEETGNLTGTETILLVEDRDMVRDLAERALKRRGYTVITAEDGEEALRVCAECEVTIDLLFTDVVMPKMNGRQLYRKISEMIPELKVLYMSGYTDNAIAHHGVLDDGVHYLQKPFKENELARKVREVLNAPYSPDMG